MGDKHVRFGSVGEDASFHEELVIRSHFSDAANHVRAAIEAQKLWILAEVDAQGFLSRDGYEVAGALQILAFHPRFMTRLLAANPAALLEAPLKFALIENARDSTSLRWLDPAAGFARYSSPALADLGIELSSICQKIREDL